MPKATKKAATKEPKKTKAKPESETFDKEGSGLPSLEGRVAKLERSMEKLRMYYAKRGMGIM